MMRRVERELAATEESARSWLEHAIAGGEALLQARELVGPEDWPRWMEENLDYGPAKVEFYMRVARDKDGFRADLASRNEALFANLDDESREQLRQVGWLE